MIVVFIFGETLDPEVMDAVEALWAEEYEEEFVI